MTTSLIRPGDDDRVESAFARILASLGSPDSLRAYQAEWKRFCQYLTVNGLTPLTAKTVNVQNYLLRLRSLNKKSSTRAHALAVIRAIYAVFSREGLLEGANPAREAKNPKGANETNTPWLTEIQLQRFLAVMPAENNFMAWRDYLIALTLALTGLRRAEVARIAIENFEPIDTAKVLLKVRVKGGKFGRVEVVRELAIELAQWCSAQGITQGPIFRPTPKASTAVKVGTIRKAVKRQARLAGFNEAELLLITPHAFRRTLATLAKKRGESIDIIQRTLMHSRRDTTMNYLKLAEEPEAAGRVLLDLLPEALRRK